MHIVYYCLFILTFASAGAALFYSVRSRRSQQPNEKGVLTAKLNISMGLMLLFIAAIQLISMDSWVRIIVGIVFLLLGLFNLFAGFRNHRYFSAMFTKDNP